MNPSNPPRPMPLFDQFAIDHRRRQAEAEARQRTTDRHLPPWLRDWRRENPNAD